MINWKLYDYRLPQELLALKPAVPRDASKLFVYDSNTDTIVFDRFYNLDKYLPKDSFLVLNQTKVLPARIQLIKQSGGKVIVLLLINELGIDNNKLGVRSYGLGGNIIKAIVDRRVKIGDKLFINKNHYFEVIGQKERIFYLKFDFSRHWLVKQLLKIGRTPVPLYLRKTPLSEVELRRKYQTVFAGTSDGARFEIGSVAAPTASLHFTKRVFNRLDKSGIKRLFVTLDVGLGTFAPLEKQNIQEKRLHEEYFEIDEEIWRLIEINRDLGKKLVAAGTTVVRTLESAVISKIKNQISKIHSKNQKIKDEEKASFFHKTNLFIFPPYKFKMVDSLITNFHLPRSSLMMLVEAFLQDKGAKRHLIDLYQVAIKERFRFYSFGDGMLII